jgi:hypothetical protein
VRQSRQALAKTIQNRRSRLRSVGRWMRRFSAWSCCRSARFSNATARCPRHASPIARRSTARAVSLLYPVAQSTPHQAIASDRILAKDTGTSPRVHRTHERCAL